MMQFLSNLFKKPPLPTLPPISTCRAGTLERGQYVIHNGYFARLVSWDIKVATIELICYTAGTQHDRSCEGSVMRVGFDSFRAATTDEVNEYLNH